MYPIIPPRVIRRRDRTMNRNEGDNLYTAVRRDDDPLDEGMDDLEPFLDS